MPAAPEARRISVDEVIESAASGVLRALESRASAGRQELSARELVKSGFFVDIMIRCGGFPGPIDVLGQKQLGPGGG
jgi:hypothetical protein